MVQDFIESYAVSFHYVPLVTSSEIEKSFRNLSLFFVLRTLMAMASLLTMSWICAC
jgi:hypothetical protein